MPRTGRPTDNPKRHDMRVRLSDGEKEKLEYCCKVLGLAKVAVIREGIEAVYERAKAQNKKE